MVTKPDPATVLPLRLNTPLVPIVPAPLRVRVCELPERVWVPTIAPSVRLRTVASTSSVTVYVPASAITTESVDCGTRPRLQLAALLQEPPTGLIHAIVCIVISNEALVAGVSAPDPAVNVYPTPGTGRLRPLKVATPATAAIAVVPESVAPPGFVPIAMSTLPIKPVAVLPRESRASTRVVNGAPAARLAGG